MKCKQCDKDIVSKGTKPALYCSDRCRKAYKRTGANGQNSKRTGQTDKPDVTVTVSVPRSKDPAILRTLGTGVGVPNYGQPDCECKQCQAYRSKGKNTSLLNHGRYKQGAHLAEHEGNRVSLPGDADYSAVVVPAPASSGTRMTVPEGSSGAVAIANTPACAQAGGST